MGIEPKLPSDWKDGERGRNRTFNLLIESYGRVGRKSVGLPTGLLSFGKMSSEPSLFGISNITVRTEVSPARKLVLGGDCLRFLLSDLGLCLQPIV